MSESGEKYKPQGQMAEVIKERGKIVSVLIPCNTIVEAAKIITDYWQETQEVEMSRNATRIYRNIIDGIFAEDDTRNDIGLETQYTSPTNMMRTSILGNVGTDKRGYRAIIQGNAVPLDNGSLGWLRKKGIISKRRSFWFLKRELL